MLIVLASDEVIRGSPVNGFILLESNEIGSGENQLEVRLRATYAAGHGLSNISVREEEACQIVHIAAHTSGVHEVPFSIPTRDDTPLSGEQEVGNLKLSVSHKVEVGEQEKAVTIIHGTSEKPIAANCLENRISVQCENTRVRTDHQKSIEFTFVSKNGTPGIRDALGQLVVGIEGFPSEIISEEAIDFNNNAVSVVFELPNIRWPNVSSRSGQFKSFAELKLILVLDDDTSAVFTFPVEFI